MYNIEYNGVDDWKVEWSFRSCIGTTGRHAIQASSGQSGRGCVMFYEYPKNRK
jgi:hypothetical protein